MSARVAMCSLIALLAMPSLRPGGLWALQDGSDVAALDVEEDIQTSDSPFRPPIVFLLRTGGLEGLAWPPVRDKESLASIRRWQIQIYDFDDRKVHFIQGIGAPSSRRIVWDGADRQGLMLRDGFYTARLVWVDAADTPRKSKPVKVGLLSPLGFPDFTGPQVSVSYMRDGMVIRLTEDLTFDAGQWELRVQSHAALEKIGTFLARYPRNRLVVQGHADSAGSAGYNRELSLKRALAIQRFLLEHGVTGERITYEGLGAAQPIASNATPAGRKLNRRVEIVLLKATI